MSASDNLSPGQLESLAAQFNDPEQGGFTVKPFGSDAGEPRKNVFAVGVRKYGMNEIPVPISGETIGDFVDTRRSVFRGNKDYNLGGWNDSEKTADVAGSLDVVQEYPVPSGAEEAMWHAHRDKEDAVGVLGPSGEYADEMRRVRPDKVYPQIIRGPYVEDKGGPPFAKTTRAERTSGQKLHKYRAMDARQKRTDLPSARLGEARDLVARMKEKADG